MTASNKTPTNGFRRSWTAARREALVWSGLIGSALTLVTGFDGLIRLSELAQALFDNWLSIIHTIWGYVLFFLPDLYSMDVVTMTMVSFIFVSVLTCVVRRREEHHSALMLASLAFGLLVMISLFALALADAGVRDRFQSTEGNNGAVYSLFSSYGMMLPDEWVEFLSKREIELASGGMGLSDPEEFALWEKASNKVNGFLFALAFFTVALAASATVKRLSEFRVSLSLLNNRVWRIISIVALVLILNEVGRYFERVST